MSSLKNFLIGCLGAFFLIRFIRLVAPELDSLERLFAYMCLVIGVSLMAYAYKDTVD